MSILRSLDYLILIHAMTDGNKIGFFDRRLKDFKAIRREYDVNFFSYLQLTSDAMPYLLTSQGRVGVMSAVIARCPYINMAVTTSTKHALDGFFQTLDIENHFRGTNVTFTIFLTGLVGTENITI